MIEELVYAYLCTHHRGKDNLIKNKDLRKLFDIRSDKSMRQVIQNIIEDKKYTEIVGSISGISGGFYICETEEEQESTINNIRHRANQMLRMCHILEYKHQNFFYLLVYILLFELFLESFPPLNNHHHLFLLLY